MSEKDVYEIIDEINTRNNTDNKIDSIYNLLDEIKNENKTETSKPNLQFNDSFENINSEDKKETSRIKLSAYANRIKPIRKPSFPTIINDYKNRSDCFYNIVQAINYGDNNEDYIQGHRKALEKYYMIAKNNSNDLNIAEGKVKDELYSYQINNNNIYYSRGYKDGLEYIQNALNRSKTLMASKINDILTSELR